MNVLCVDGLKGGILQGVCRCFGGNSDWMLVDPLAATNHP